MQARSKRLVTLLAPLAGLVLLELGVRVLSSERIPAPVARGVLFQVSLVPGLTYENRPGAVRTIEYRDRAGAPPRIVEHRVNEQGLRGPLASPKSPGTLRVVCVGDSHTFGAGVAEAEAWPGVLHELANRDPSTRGAVEVLNAGVNAYDTGREVLLLRTRLLDHEPDVVLLQYHVNDVHARNALGWKPPFDDWLWRLSDPARGDWITRLRSVSQLADVVLDRLHASRGVRDESGLSLAGYGPGDEGWRSVTEALLEARDLLAERDIRFGVVLFPTLLADGDVLSSHRAFERVAAFCRSNGIDVLDTEPALLQAVQHGPHSLADLRVHAHDPHAGPEAHAIVAHEVWEWLSGSP